jgi:hypothetical protein
MQPSIAESRILDRADDESNLSLGIPAQPEEKIEHLNSEPTMSRTRYCAELAQLLKRDVHDLMEEQIFQSCSSLPRPLAVNSPRAWDYRKLFI